MSDFDLKPAAEIEDFQDPNGWGGTFQLNDLRPMLGLEPKTDQPPMTPDNRYDLTCFLARDEKSAIDYLKLTGRTNQDKDVGASDTWSPHTLWRYWCLLNQLTYDDQKMRSSPDKGKMRGQLQTMVRLFGPWRAKLHLDNIMVQWGAVQQDLKLKSGSRPSLGLILHFKEKLEADLDKGGSSNANTRGIGWVNTEGKEAEQIYTTPRAEMRAKKEAVRLKMLEMDKKRMRGRKF